MYSCAYLMLSGCRLNGCTEVGAGKGFLGGEEEGSHRELVSAEAEPLFSNLMA